ncbi:chitinase-3-like protein 1 [Lingula anatina]|uniref:Chitinase-3-like protein 1 n=1 Tax=Lingula anatina TaxID=7574 RepID=A0A1S3HKA4_LINAN|nr:chitinase-3-like protein 1 [Lingula anatina]|eukprot:XP_013386543.1 chitinase-3-like protein 1 [Lingula anatina]
MDMRHLTVLLMGIYVFSLTQGSGYKRVCYYTNWSQYRTDDSIKFFPANINASLCTHIIYAFANISAGGLKPDQWNDVLAKPNIGMYAKVNNLKVNNPDLKVLLAVGGWEMGTAPFIAVSTTREKRQNFISGTVQFLRQHDFDGLDYDWEFPDADSKSNFTALLKETNEKFETEAAATGKKKLILSAAVATGKWALEQGGYEVEEVSRSVDFINLMTYDFHELGPAQEKRLVPNAALFSGDGENDAMAPQNVDYAVKMWIEKGAQPNKLVLGLGAYGRNFKTLNGNTTPGAQALDNGPAGKYINESGMYPYFEICENLKDPSWEEQWDDKRKVPYAFNRQENLWVGYDNPTSIKEKVDYAVSKNLAGIMIWSLDMDDFKNKCGKGSYPLLRVANERLAVYENSATTAMNPTTTLVLCCGLLFTILLRA